MIFFHIFNADYTLNQAESDDVLDISQKRTIRTGLFVSVWETYQTKDQILEEVRSDKATARGATPTISNVLPSSGSIAGGQLITITGFNFASQNLDMGGILTDSSVVDDGEDYLIWFEKDGEDPVYCDIDRMNNLVAEQVGNYESVFCKTRPFPIDAKYRLKMTIDGGKVINGKDVTFKQSTSPEIQYMFPSASAPARNKDAPMTENAVWSRIIKH